MSSININALRSRYEAMQSYMKDQRVIQNPAKHLT